MPLPTVADLSPLDWTDCPTRHVFFTGKGGVGKTTTASGIAVALATAGRRTLLISTDPASNLQDIFDITAGTDPAPVEGLPELWLANIDPEQAAADYRERAIAPYRGVLPDSALGSMEEQLSGACTVEIAAFNEFTTILTGGRGDGYDHVLFDTAPTGHTLRLLTLPGAWSGYARDNPAGASCLGPLAGLDRQQRQYQDAVATLADPDRTRLVLVARAEPSALREAARASAELRRLGVCNQQLVINGVLRHPGTDPTAQAFTDRQETALVHAPDTLSPIPVAAIDLVAGNLTGIAALRQLITGVRPIPSHNGHAASIELPDLATLIDDLDQAGRGVVMTMGKGGVGKTTIAAAIAIALADRGHPITLSTTDPAAHLTEALADETPHGLRVDRIDPAAETKHYSAEVLAAATASGLDAEGAALLAEDLRSPCTEEIAVFRAFARTVDHANDRIVVLDTAPTGHTLLLLDAAESYQREIQRTNADVPDAVRQLASRLRDPEYARVLIITLAESTPIHEAERLQADLRRAGIEPHGWIVNATTHQTRTSNPTLRARADAELPHLDRVQSISTARTWTVPWQQQAPTGATALRALGEPNHTTSPATARASGAHPTTH